jgi:replicative DNA helicase
MPRRHGRKGTGHMDERLAEAEVGVIGAAMLEPDRVLGMLARWGVRPEWFESRFGRSVAEVAMPMHAAGEPVDLLTVGARLRRCGNDTEANQLEVVLERVPTAAHAPFYLGLLRDGWLTRAARNAAAEMSKALDAPEFAPKDTVAAAVATLTALIAAGSKGQERTAWEVMRDCVELWSDAAKGKRSAKGLPWMFESMNALSCGMYPGINVLAARPSAGKTLTEGQVSRNLMMLGKRVARACLDMQDEPFLSRDLCAMAGESLNKLRAGYMTSSDETKVRLSLAAMKQWKQHLLYERTSEGIVARARALWANEGLDLLTVDYAQLLDVGVSGRDNDNVRISKAVARLKEFSLGTGVPVLLLSQLSREVEKEGRVPQLSDLRDSGSIEQEASTVVFLYSEPKIAKLWVERQDVRDWKSLKVRPVVWELLKNQNGMTGTVGMRTHAAYFVSEEAMQTKEFTEETSFGYDFGEPQRPCIDEPNASQYAVCRHAKGAVEAFSLPWFEVLRETAAREGLEGYELIAQVTGVENAVRRRGKEIEKLKQAARGSGR